MLAGTGLIFSSGRRIKNAWIEFKSLDKPKTRDGDVSCELFKMKPDIVR